MKKIIFTYVLLVVSMIATVCSADYSVYHTNAGDIYSINYSSVSEKPTYTIAWVSWKYGNPSEHENIAKKDIRIRAECKNYNLWSTEEISYSDNNTVVKREVKKQVLNMPMDSPNYKTFSVICKGCYN